MIQNLKFKDLCNTHNMLMDLSFFFFIHHCLRTVFQFHSGQNKFTTIHIDRIQVKGGAYGR